LHRRQGPNLAISKHLQQVLRKLDGRNRVQAAKLVGLPRRTFYRRLKEFGLV
jgi:transcriptional regulator of acetoin/glycerol metabolism